MTNLEVVSMRTGIPQNQLASNLGPDDWFFWCGNYEYEVSITPRGRRVTRVSTVGPIPRWKRALRAVPPAEVNPGIVDAGSAKPHEE